MSVDRPHATNHRHRHHRIAYGMIDPAPYARIRNDYDDDDEFACRAYVSTVGFSMIYTFCAQFAVTKSNITVNIGEAS